MLSLFYAFFLLFILFFSPLFFASPLSFFSTTHAVGKNPFIGPQGPLLLKIAAGSYAPISPTLGYSAELVSLVHACMERVYKFHSPSLSPSLSFLLIPFSFLSVVSHIMPPN
jgi:hypothetical protein